MLGEEELSDVSLATFYVIDKENAAAAQSGVKVAWWRVAAAVAAAAAGAAVAAVAGAAADAAAGGAAVAAAVAAGLVHFPGRMQRLLDAGCHPLALN